jgi:predicted dehydrogenase
MPAGWRDIPGAQLVSVHDVIPEMAAETSRELGVQAASSVDEVLGNPSDCSRADRNPDTYAC